MAERTEGEERMRAMALRAAHGDEEAADLFMNGLNTFVHALVLMLHANADEAPNFITVNYETPAEHYEITIRRSSKSALVARIGAVEAELERLRAKLAGGSDG